MLKENKLPPHCGVNVNEPLLYNPYQQAFQAARRLRHCFNCNTQGSMDTSSVFVCAKCLTKHTSNLTAPRVYDRLLVLAGRGGGKTCIGAHAAREEMMVPDSIGWVMGPTYKILWDSTFPTLMGLIPREWVKKWDAEHQELTLINNARVMFRSLEDPERARGPHGVAWGWFDEAAQSPERAYDVFQPTLIKAGGIVIATTTVMGYDWTYDRIEKLAQVYKEPGYWATRYWTEENPLFASNIVMQREITRAKKTMTEEFYAQEYKAERHNATGLIYNYKAIEKQTLRTMDEVRKLIPEWPKIDPSRPVIIGLDSGSDHPFGAVKIIVTEGGLVCVQEYLKRQQAVSTHLGALTMQFNTGASAKVQWAANKNEANLRLEFGLKGYGVIPAESSHAIGIQRVQAWLLTGQLWFVEATCPGTIEQFKAYRYANNLQPDGQKKAKEDVFKVKDELPDAVRYAIMSWPSLPETEKPEEGRDLRAMDEKTQWEIRKVREFGKRGSERDLEPAAREYPTGDFFNGRDDEDDGFVGMDGGW